MLQKSNEHWKANSPNTFFIVQCGCVGKVIIWKVRSNSYLGGKESRRAMRDSNEGKESQNDLTMDESNAIKTPTAAAPLTEISVVKDYSELIDRQYEIEVVNEVMLDGQEASCCHLALSPANGLPHLLYLGTVNGPILRYTLQ